MWAKRERERERDRTAPTNVLMRRYIDDIIVMGPDARTPGKGLPTEEEYGMSYKGTAEAEDSLIYLGVRLFVDDRGQAHSVLHDRAVDYPIRVDRYPHGTTVANPAQLAGVIMGRLVAAQRTCSRMDLFQDAVAGVFTHACRRGYSRRMVHSTWTRFLWRYWDAASVTTRELRAWFHDAWRAVTEAETGEGRQRRPIEKWPRWEASVPEPKGKGKGHAQAGATTGTRSAREPPHNTSAEAPQHRAAGPHEALDALLDLTTPPASPTARQAPVDVHAKGSTQQTGGNAPARAASSQTMTAPPRIPLPFPLQLRAEYEGPRGGPMRVGRGNDGGKWRGRRAESTPGYPSGHASNSDWGRAPRRLCPGGGWGRGTAGTPQTKPQHTRMDDGNETSEGTPSSHPGSRVVYVDRPVPGTLTARCPCQWTAWCRCPSTEWCRCTSSAQCRCPCTWNGGSRWTDRWRWDNQRPQRRRGAGACCTPFCASSKAGGHQGP